MAVLRGQIKARGDIQMLHADLYGLYEEKHAIIRAKFSSIFSIVCAAAFSLWRAAFLTHTTGADIPGLDDCAQFIGKVARDNAIGFAQDRESREWTAGYYLNNAVVRLAALRNAEGFESERWLDVYQQHAKNLRSWDTHEAMTRTLIDATERAFRRLEALIVAAQSRIV